MALTRRHFLALATALAQTSVRNSYVLAPGETLGLISPSTYVSDPNRLALDDHTLKYFDLKAKASETSVVIRRTA